MRADILARIMGHHLVGKSVRTFPMGDHPGGVFRVISVGGDPEVPIILEDLEHGVDGEMGIIDHEEVELLHNKDVEFFNLWIPVEAALPEIRENWINQESYPVQVVFDGRMIEPGNNIHRMPVDRRYAVGILRDRGMVAHDGTQRYYWSVAFPGLSLQTIVGVPEIVGKVTHWQPAPLMPVESG